MLKNFISYLFKADISKPVARWLLPEAEAEEWQMPDPAIHENQTKLYATLDTIGAVVDIVTETCIDADFDILDSNDKEIDNHPFDLLINKPNEFDSRTEFLRGHFSNRKLYGNSYWFMNRTNKNAKPDELFIISPEKIVPVVDGKMGLRGYAYYPGNGDKIALETYEILHIKSYNPYSRYIGLSALVSLAVRAYGAKAAQEWNTRLFAQNNARLPGILAFAEMIQDSDWDRMKKEVATAAEKRNNMMLRGVGKGGVEWMQGTATQKEMEFLEGIKATEEAIYNRLAPGLYSTMQNTALTNGVTGMSLFMGSTIQPMLRELTDKINSSILPAYGSNIHAEYEDVLPQDKAMELAEIASFAQFHTVDEVRVEKFGNKPDPDPERGKLFVVQVTPPAAEAAPVAEQPVTDQPIDTQPEQVDAMPPAVPTMPEEMKADLHRWKRKAMRAVGTPEAVQFTSENIPAELNAQIAAKLSTCKTADEAEGVFVAIKYSKPQETDTIKALADAINHAVSVVITDAPKYET